MATKQQQHTCLGGCNSSLVSVVSSIPLLALLLAFCCNVEGGAVEASFEEEFVEVSRTSRRSSFCLLCSYCTRPRRFCLVSRYLTGRKLIN